MFSFANSYAASKLFEGKKIDQIKPIFVEFFTDKNWEVDQDTNTRLVLSNEIGSGTGFAISLLNNLVNTASNSASGSNPRNEISFTFVQKAEGVNVIGAMALLTPLSNGNVQKQRLDGDSEVAYLLDSFYNKIYGKTDQNTSNPDAIQTFRVVNGTPLVFIGKTTYSVMEYPKTNVLEVTDSKNNYEKVKEILKFGESVNEQEAKQVIDIYLKNTSQNSKSERIDSVAAKSGQYVIWCDKQDGNYPNNCALIRGLAGTIVTFSVGSKANEKTTLVMRKFSPKQ